MTNINKKIEESCARFEDNLSNIFYKINKNGEECTENKHIVKSFLSKELHKIVDDIREEMVEELKKINRCFTEIRTLENKKMKESQKNNKVFDSSVNKWCVVGERIIFDLYLLQDNKE